MDNEYAHVRAENDWTTQQARRFPARLVPFCGVNPLKDVDLLSLRHVDTIRRVFQAVNEHRRAMVVHVRGDLTVYGREQAEKFLDLLSAARDVPSRSPIYGVVRV